MIHASILPPNSTPMEEAVEQVAASVLDSPVPIATICSPDACPIDFLPWLAWALSVDEWDASWSEEQKRSAIRSSLAVHRRKGTIGAVQDALAALSFEARVQEWFNQVPSGDPYTFRVLLEAGQVGIPQSGYSTLLRVIQRTKNLRSHLDRVEVSLRNVSRPRAVVAAGIGTEICIANYVRSPVALNETTICI